MTGSNIEKGQAFISREYKSQKEKIKELINGNTKPHKEDEKLNSNLRQMEQKLMENRDVVSELNQCNRSSYMVEISGIPFKKGENYLEIINKVERMADIEDYEPGQVHVMLWTSRKKTAPIIVLFHKKREQQNFYRQKKKLYSFNVNQFLDGLPEGEDQGWGEDLNKNGFIFLNESLTGTNRKLLKEAKKTSERFALQ